MKCLSCVHGLRPSNIDPSTGSQKEVGRIVERIRARWPQVRIILRGDSGFCRDKLMSWCEENGVDYVLGMARNNGWRVSSLRRWNRHGWNGNER
jgi:hypothetical protein